MAIYEHRTNEEKGKQIMKKITANWRYSANYDSKGKGRIWVMWDPNNIQFIEMWKSNQLIHGKLKIGKDYGRNWKGSKTEIDEAWIAMGDYNAVKGVEDRKSENPVQEVEIRDFRDFMLNNGMNELKYIGRNFTWTNNHVWSKIDRAIVNAEWMTTMNQMEVVVMEPFISDHTPLCLQFEEINAEGPKPYRFYNYVAEHPDFLQVVDKAWSTVTRGEGMERIWQKLKAVNIELKKMHTEEFKKVRETVRTIRKQLQETQEKMQDPNHPTDLFDTEKELRRKLEKWVLIEESILRQKSRTKWLKLGDSNSAYFYACMKSRTSTNHIKILMTQDGKLLQNDKEVEEEVVGFYKKLLGNADEQI
ncbi:PREDICTED: uncharacterized protein LOC109241192 [Nicotiana attenuata]|uniref:uncharacterized protein LOC109241192 n=1 Tax=Nicotiana attenuata TaxID=49451 RepID=UPI000904F260|nr:PREDICTED: uncharacterized protein LOC109241192 [Nicotiana attenuata]